MKKGVCRTSENIKSIPPPPPGPPTRGRIVISTGKIKTDFTRNRKKDTVATETEGNVEDVTETDGTLEDETETDGTVEETPLPPLKVDERYNKIEAD